MSNHNASPLPMTRRRFIYTSALAAGATVVTGPIFAASPRKLSANDKLNIGCVGCGGKGSGDIQWCASGNIEALCDVTERARDRQNKNFPKANVYNEYRDTLETEKTLDAIDLATPCSMHAA